MGLYEFIHPQDATLERLGVTFYRGRTVTEYDGDVYEIVDRATHEPLFAAIPKEA